MNNLNIEQKKFIQKIKNYINNLILKLKNNELNNKIDNNTKNDIIEKLMMLKNNIYDDLIEIYKTNNIEYDEIINKKAEIMDKCLKNKDNIAIKLQIYSMIDIINNIENKYAKNLKLQELQFEVKVKDKLNLIIYNINKCNNIEC